MSDAKARKQIQDRLMTLIGKFQELEQICVENDIDLYPEIHIDDMEQQLMAAHAKLAR